MPKIIYPEIMPRIWRQKEVILDLSGRKKKILQVVIDDYIDNIEPISSKKVQKKHLQEVSSATIRSELAALEEMGYLGQPHTSAGRIPLPKAYRYYVDKLMKKGRLTNNEIDYIRNHFTKNMSEAEVLVKNAAKVISEITNYTGIGLEETREEEIIQNIKLVQLTDKTVLLIVITESRVIKDSIITTDKAIDELYIETGADILRNLFCGRNIYQAIKIGEDIIAKEFDRYRFLFDNIMDVFKKYIDKNGEKMVMEGATKMLRYPEFSDIEKARNFLSIIDSKSKLISMLKDGSTKSVELSIKIGSEEQNDDIKDFSLVTANYSVMGKTIGSAGVIGPIRMDYSKVVSVLECIRETIDVILKK